jgi:hypothetical protein
MDLLKETLTIRAGSQDYIDWELLNEDETPISLTSAVELVFVMLRLSDKQKIEYSTKDSPQKFFVIDDDLGQVQLRPASDDFSSPDDYKIWVNVIDVVGSHPVPEDKNEDLKVIGNFSEYE